MLREKRLIYNEYAARKESFGPWKDESLGSTPYCDTYLLSRASYTIPGPALCPQPNPPQQAKPGVLQCSEPFGYLAVLSPEGIWICYK